MQERADLRKELDETKDEKGIVESKLRQSNDAFNYSDE